MIVIQIISSKYDNQHCIYTILYKCLVMFFKSFNSFLYICFFNKRQAFFRPVQFLMKWGIILNVRVYLFFKYGTLLYPVLEGSRRTTFL